jgi:hypothetical protein
VGWSFAEASATSKNPVLHKQQPSGMGMAVGSRAHLEKDAIAKRTAFRNFLMHGFHLLVVAVAGTAVRDTQCGFKVRLYKEVVTLSGPPFSLLSELVRTAFTYSLKFG